MHGAGHGAGVQGVADPEGRLESAVSDAGLCFLGDKVEDCGSGGLATSAGGGGNSDEGTESFRYGETTAQRGVHEIEKVCLGEAGVEIHELSGVDDLD